MQDIQEIKHSTVANVLTDKSQLRLLEPFFRTEVSLSEVAEELSMKLNTLLYQVNKFINLSILEVVREVPRKGRATKFYRATAKEFFIPFEITTSLSLEDFLFDTVSGGERIFHHELAKMLQTFTSDIGFIVSLNAQNQLFLGVSDKTRQGFCIFQANPRSELKDKREPNLKNSRSLFTAVEKLIYGSRERILATREI